MKRANKFYVSPNWKILLIDMDIDPVEALIFADLPVDLFNRQNMTLTPAQYYQLFEGIEKAAGGREVPLLLARHLSVESFDPPIFASLCSANLNQALQRLAQYKPLIGPLILNLDIDSTRTRLVIECYGYNQSIPGSLSMSEAVFFTQLARIATRTNVSPLFIAIPDVPKNISIYQQYFGCDITQADKVTICFTAKDARQPFLTSNSAMLNFFEDKLGQQLKDLDSGATIVERVRAVLVEALPVGNSSIESVAKRLAISKRTLQRKLADESKSYQSVLQTVRSELADHYLDHSQLSLAEISFLLGFQEPNSFIRAYQTWRGLSPGQYRERQH